MAYMEDQAQEREQLRQRMLGGQTPAAMEPQQGVSLGGLPANFDIGQLLQSLAQSLTPQKVRETATPELQVPMTAPIRTGPPAPEQWRGDDVDLGSALSGIFDKAKGSALQDMLKAARGASTRDAADRGKTAATERLRSQVPSPTATGPAATEYVQSKIPGLKPAIDANAAPPGMPGAMAYQEQQRTDIPPIRMEEKGGGVGYKADIQFLQDRGGHTSKLVDGKITNTPLSEKGAYKDLDPELAARLRKGAEDYEAATGKRAKFGEFSRGEDVQKIYRDRYERGGGLAARPGQSRHQHGGAGDIPPGEFRDWMDSNRKTYGVDFPHANDKVHVQLDPDYKGQPHAKASPDAPALPAWDKGLPQQDAKTEWPDPTQPQAPTAAEVTPPAEGTRAAPQSTAQPGNALVEQRKPIADFFDANPAQKDRMAAIALVEDGNSSNGRVKIHEANANRIVSAGRAPGDVLDPSYYADLRKGGAKVAAAEAKIKADPQLRAQLHAEIDQAVKQGTNHSNLATDFASAGVAASSATNSTETIKPVPGENRFFRKDQSPGVHGDATVAKVKDWHAKTEAAVKGTGAAPAAGQAAAVEKPPVPAMETAAEVMKERAPSAESAPSAMRTADAFEKGAEAVPTPGLGGLQEDPDYAGYQTTTRTIQDSAGEALNAIPKPEAPAVAVPDTTSAAVAPVPVADAPPPAPAVTAPPPPPPRAAAPAPPPRAAVPAASPGLSKAHALLDMSAGEFVGKYAPEHLGKVKMFGYANTPMREVVKIPGVGKQVIDGLAPHMTEHGMTMQDFQKAMTQPSPGRQSQAPPGYRSIAPGLMPETAPQTFKPSPYEGATQSPDVIDRRGQAGRGRLELGTKLGMNPNPGMDQHWYNEPEVAERVAQETPLSKALGADDIERSVSTRLDAMRAEAKATPPYTPQPPTAQEIEANRPALPPGIADALVQSVQEQGPPIDMKPPPPEALPVLPATDIAPPAPGAPGGLGLAPPGLDLAAPGAGPFQTAMGVPGSQGGGIATLGVINNATFSTPLLDSMARQPTVGQGNLAPFSWSMPASWGWNTGSGGGGFDTGSLFGGSMGDTSGGFAGGWEAPSTPFMTPMTWGG